ncbi:glycoside hydrolase family 6 protein [Ceratobasidium sp. AG-Ba]|nr:glycoside hydrolase family 6 protein [Ceratobasidium sp. AG-Ba]
MHRTLSVGAFAAAFMASAVSAQQPMYAQCGGINWTGGTTCVSGASCQKLNDYYFQCLPGSAPTTSKPVTTSTTKVTSSTPTSTTSVGPSPTGNPYAGKVFYANTVYRAKVQAEYNKLISEGNSALAAKVAKVGDISTGIWIADRASVSSISTYLQDALNVQNQSGKKQVVPLVVYDLPDRDCSGGASAGEFSSANGGEAKYQEYIQAVYAQFKAFPSITLAVSLEPDSIGNMVSNQGIPFCATAAPVQKRGLAYAISVLGTLPNVNLYLDGAHATWLGWPDSLGPTAKVLGDIYAAAKQLNPNAIVRGVGTDVSNYNGLDQEVTYHTDLAPYLTAVGYPAHFIVDQGRSGNQNITRSGEDWCNLKFAGLGPRPSANTPSSIVDAILWVKPPGESDGSSDPSSSRYNPVCASNTSFVPSPEAGSWASGSFRAMVQYANPPL